MTDIPPSEQPTELVVIALTAGGMLMIALGVVLGLIVDPILFVIAAVGAIDFALAWGFSTGRIGPRAARRRARDAGAADAAAETAQTDSPYNPYARED